MNAKVIDHQEAIKNMMAERYLLRELSENERDAYEAHLFDCQICFEQVKAGSEFVSYIKGIGEEKPATTVAMQPLWRYFLRYLSRPVLAPGFAVLFLCFASLSLYQGWVIQQFKKPQAMATTSLKEARRGDDATVVTARRNSVFPLHFLFSSSTEYDSYEGQISLDMGDNSASSTNPDKGKAPLKAFPISGRDAQEPITVNLYSGDLHEGDYVLEVLGVKEGNSKVSIATYYFKLRLQK